MGAVFKTDVAEHLGQAGSIPVRLRQTRGDLLSGPQSDAQLNPEKNPEDWTTGEEPMTGPQQSYLSTSAQEAGVEVPEGLTKAEASTLIDELQAKTGRGK